ncbi:hypothetical protein ACMFMG_004137 [Clarireedia jacksonii]
MSPPPYLEIATFTLPSALLAARSGAHRIELCRSKSSDGLTPSVNDFISLASYLQSQSQSQSPSRVPSPPQNADDQKKASEQDVVVEQTPSPSPEIKINIMIRPTSNARTSFTVDSTSYLSMQSQILQFRRAGGQGFVFGILKRDAQTGRWRVDAERCGALVKLCRSGDGEKENPSTSTSIRCTFHRAFDLIASEDMGTELESLISLSFTSVLTSGGASTALAGAAAIKNLVALARGRIEIIAGGGVRSANVGEVRRRAGGVQWVHSSAVVGEGEEVDEGEVRGLRRGIDC